MTDEMVDVFFYGSFMDPDVLAKCGLKPRDLRAAKAPNYSIGFAPMATMTTCPGAAVWGVACRLAVAPLERVYRLAPLADYGYFTRRISISDVDEKPISAVVYLTRRPVGARPEKTYLENIIRISERWNFPPEYLTLLRSFLSPA